LIKITKEIKKSKKDKGFKKLLLVIGFFFLKMSQNNQTGRPSLSRHFNASSFFFASAISG